MAYEFHYTPTGTGVISGKEVLEQTEDAINDLSGQISGDVQIAIDTANNALNTANTASADAQNAINTANTAYTAATNAQNTANTAQNTASNALTAAQNAQNDVNALGNRVTTAEGNITQNTNAITGLTTRMGTAEGNIGNLQTAVSTAQATATSAQNTATLARGQAYVVRYASVAVSDNSSVPYTDLNNTDNIKANDLLLDTTGKIYQISSVDTANETVSVTTPLTQLAIDSGVVHKSGNETVAGEKTFTDYSFGNSGYGFIGGGNRTSYILPEFTGGSSGLSIVTPDFNKSVKIGSWTTNENTGKKVLNTATGYLQISTGSMSGVNTVSITPLNTVNSNLGNVNNKWKTFNGLTPSSLGMPVAPSSTSYVDISGYITVLDSSSANTYTPPSNGYITFSVTGNLVQIFHDYGLQGKWTVQAGNANRGFIPVLGGVEVEIYITASSVDKFWFIPCQGNV